MLVPNFYPGVSFKTKSWCLGRVIYALQCKNTSGTINVPKKTRYTEPALFCDVCLYLDSIGGLGSDSASKRIRSIAKKEGKTVVCAGHRSFTPVINNSAVDQRWEYTVWTCAPTYAGTTWGGLKEECCILQRHRSTMQV